MISKFPNPMGYLLRMLQTPNWTCGYPRPRLADGRRFPALMLSSRFSFARLTAVGEISRPNIVVSGNFLARSE